MIVVIPIMVNVEKLQEIENKISNLQSEITIAEKRREAINKDIAGMQKQVEELGDEYMKVLFP